MICALLTIIGILFAMRAIWRGPRYFTAYMVGRAGRRLNGRLVRAIARGSGRNRARRPYRRRIARRRVR